MDLDVFTMTINGTFFCPKYLCQSECDMQAAAGWWCQGGPVCPLSQITSVTRFTETPSTLSGQVLVSHTTLLHGTLGHNFMCLFVADKIIYMSSMPNHQIIQLKHEKVLVVAVKTQIFFPYEQKTVWDLNKYKLLDNVMMTLCPSPCQYCPRDELLCVCSSIHKYL